MKHWLGDDRCDCHPLFGTVDIVVGFTPFPDSGSPRECDRFGHLLYDHPCESLLKRELRRDDYRVGVTKDYGRRRTTRSPSSVQINEWKKQLSGGEKDGSIDGYSTQFRIILSRNSHSITITRM